MLAVNETRLPAPVVAPPRESLPTQLQSRVLACLRASNRREDLDRLRGRLAVDPPIPRPHEICRAGKRRPGPRGRRGRVLEVRDLQPGRRRGSTQSLRELQRAADPRVIPTY